MVRGNGGPALDAERLLDLTRRIAELERVLRAGDADRPLDFEETVAQATTRSVSTVRDWWRRKAARKRYRLDILFVKDVTGRLTSTPRRVSQWQAAVRAANGAK
jgi:hypothetical protein